MNTYEIVSGRWKNDAGETLGYGYSGGDVGKAPEAVNNVQFQAVPFVGPIPEGQYAILSPVDTEDHGPYFLPLYPAPQTNTYGRSGFGLHGDLVTAPGKRAGSEGCIVLPPDVRHTIWESGDHDLTVVSGLQET